MVIFFNLICVALACGGISFTITTTSLFKTVREWISNIHPKLDQLIHCPWCLGHWVTLLYMIIGKDNSYALYITKYEFTDFLITLFTIISIEGLLHYILLRAYEPVAKQLAQRTINKLKEKNNV